MEEDLRRLSPSLELRTVDGMGRGVLTKESARDTIFSALPIAHCSVEETRGTICEHCFNRSESLKKCSQCKFVQHCNSNCQTECKGVRGGKATPLVRLALRALTRDTQHLCSLPDGWFTSEEANKDQEASKDQETRRAWIAHTAQLCDYPLHVISKLFLKLVYNQFSIMTTNNISKMGEALYSAPSLLNHSCRPNTLQLFNGRQLILKAVRDIGPDEQLFITYTETLQLLSERQYVLQSVYNFTCACERCLEDISKSPGCSEQLLLMGANGREISSSLRQKMEKELTELKGLHEREEWQVMYYKGRALYTSHLTQLSPDNIFSQRLMEHLFNASASLCLGKEALKYITQLLGPSLCHYGLLDPGSVYWLMLTGKFRYDVGTTEQLTLSLDDLTKARTAAETLYGADHPVTREAAMMLSYTRRELAH